MQKILLDNWQRKVISLFLAVLIWFLVNQSLISSKTISNIPVRVINIPSGKTIIDLQANGFLTRRLTLTLIGNKTLLEELSANDFEVVVDAQNKQGEWIASINKRNLVSLNPEIDLSKGISRISHANVLIRLTKLATEKIPIYLTQPIGEAPKEYQFLDVWPYQLYLTVSGSEEVVKKLKTKGIRLTFDLTDVSKADLDRIQTKAKDRKTEEVSFLVPESWKRVNIPSISDTPIEIDDPRAKEMRMDFIRISNLPLKKPINLALFFPEDTLSSLNPRTVSISSASFLKELEGVYFFKDPIYVKGVSQTFLEVVDEMLQFEIIVQKIGEKSSLTWGVQFINAKALEDRYVSLMAAEEQEELTKLQPGIREEYIRNRFRSYMNTMQLYKTPDRKLEFNITLENGKIVIKVL